MKESRGISVRVTVLERGNDVECLTEVSNPGMTSQAVCKVLLLAIESLVFKMPSYTPPRSKADQN